MEGVTLNQSLTPAEGSLAKWMEVSQTVELNSIDLTPLEFGGTKLKSTISSLGYPSGRQAGRQSFSLPSAPAHGPDAAHL